MPESSTTTHALGISWVVKEAMQRACHAVVSDDCVWVIDPVADEDALSQVESLGKPAAVLQLLDRHNRDCAAVADRLAVPHLKVPDAVPDSPFEVIPVLRNRLWKESALWWPERSALIVAETVGTSRLFTAGQGQVGMHPLLRPLPPSALRGRRSEHLLVGHGPNVHGPEAADGLEEAYARARRDIPSVLKMLPGMIRG